MPKITKTAQRYWDFILTIIIGAAALIGAATTNGWAPRTIWNWPQLLISAWGIILSLILLVDMIKELRSGKYGVDILVVTAIVACVAIGQFWAALVLILMSTGGKALENYANGRARRELSALLKRAPHSAHLCDKTGAIREISIAQINPGDILLIKSAEVVPVDGELLSERADFDESSLTGESLPVAKKAGDAIMSGSVNGSSSVKLRATASAKNSQYEKIIALVRESESHPAPFVRMADRYALLFTVVSYLIAIGGWIASGDSLRFAEVLVVASPCPLILAAPIAMISGMSHSAHHGIIVKNGGALEQFARAKAIAFDKTGTLTRGVVEVDEIIATDKINRNELLRLAASAEAESSHVLAESLVKFAKEHKITLAPTKNLREITGSGVYATIEKSRIITGRRDFLAQNKIAKLPDADGRTAIWVAIGDRYVGRIVFADQLRKNSHSTIAQLKKLGLQKIVMLTGDNAQVASQIAATVGVDFCAELLPEDKVREIKQLHKKYGAVAMVGDGVNDAPVLAASDVGIAMGARGNTAASESANVVIVPDDISRIAIFRRIAGATVRIALQSVRVGIALCLVLEFVAALGFIPAIIGAGLQELIDVTVILNALRALTAER